MLYKYVTSKIPVKYEILGQTYVDKKNTKKKIEQKQDEMIDSDEILSLLPQIKEFQKLQKTIGSLDTQKDRNSPFAMIEYTKDNEDRSIAATIYIGRHPENWININNDYRLVFEK